MSYSTYLHINSNIEYCKYVSYSGIVIGECKLNSSNHKRYKKLSTVLIDYIARVIQILLNNNSYSAPDYETVLKRKLKPCKIRDISSG